MKYIYRASIEQLEAERERQTRYLKHFLADSDRCKVSGYIKECFKVLNAVKLAIKEKLA
jgi:hypothetical protein